MNRRLITTGALALALFALSGTTASAQDRGHDQNDHYRSRQNGDESNRPHHPTFSDRDRQVTRDWYVRNRSHLGRGWTERDRLSPAMERRLRRGVRLEPVLRARMYWLPADLTRRYGPAPRGYRYAIIGGNIVLLDSDYFVRDVFRIDIRLH